ncbi:MAG TPA: thiamine pyrophosphate-binding protein [Polyangiaceae bacterium]|jgi:acetolactate synthase-1/2/3 large subunit
MKLVDALVHALLAWDVRYVFGVSGANIEHLHDAIHRMGGQKLQAILAKSEVGAAFMADARARVHRTLGVCCATSGGGMMNLAVGVAEAYAESVPMLALVGQIPAALEGRGGFQDSSGIGRTVDALGMWRSMSKYAARVDEAAGFWEKLAEAARQALEGRPGPSVLLLSRDAYELEVGECPEWFPTSLAPLAAPAPASDDAVRALFDAARAAKNPVLVLGTGAARSSDPDAVVRFAMAAGIPVVTTMANPGAFPNDHPLYLGTIGAAGHPSAHAYLNERADWILAVGTGLASMVRQPLAKALARCQTAAVNVDAGELRRIAKPSLVAEADAGVVFQALLALHDAEPFTHPPVSYELSRYLPEIAEVAPASGPRVASGGDLLQSQAIEILEAHLPHDGHILFDAGNCAAAAIHGMTLPPRASSTIALGMGGMGYAIAGAIGAQLGDARRTRSVVLCGDGAFLMLGLEVHTAVEHELPILFVVFNNARHGMCVTRQQVYFDGRIESSEYPRVDIATVARGLGDPSRLWVGRAGTPGQLRSELERYRSRSHGPGVLELALMREEVPPFAPFLRPDHPTYVVRPAARGWVQPAA